MSFKYANYKPKIATNCKYAHTLIGVRALMAGSTSLLAFFTPFPLPLIRLMRGLVAVDDAHLLSKVAGVSTVIISPSIPLLVYL